MTIIFKASRGDNESMEINHFDWLNQSFKFTYTAITSGFFPHNSPIDLQFGDHLILALSNYRVISFYGQNILFHLKENNCIKCH